MKTLIIFALLTWYAESKNADNCVQGIMNYKEAEEEVLLKDVGSPYQLAIDYEKNILFFSHTRDNNGKSTFESAYIDLNTNEFKIIKGINGGFANAVDQVNHIVYIGSQDGIYKYDYKSNLAKHIDGSNQKIWQLFFKKDLYYTTYPDEEVYIFKQGQSRRVPQLQHTRGMLVALDTRDNIYFSNSSGLFIYEMNNQKASASTFYIGDYTLNGFTSDINGRLFFSTPNAIFTIDDSNREVKKLVSIDDVYGVAVERDGSLLYASENSIVRLKPSHTVC